MTGITEDGIDAFSQQPPIKTDDERVVATRGHLLDFG